MTAPDPERWMLDTNCFIYLFEEPETATGRTVGNIFRRARRGELSLVTSSVCLSEYLVGVARGGDSTVVDRAIGAFLRLPGLSVLPVATDVAVRAAELRAASALRLFDAIVVATGHAAGATRLVTNDRTLAKANHGLLTALLDELEA